MQGSYGASHHGLSQHSSTPAALYLHDFMDGLQTLSLVSVGSDFNMAFFAVDALGSCNCADDPFAQEDVGKAFQ